MQGKGSDELLIETLEWPCGKKGGFARELWLVGSGIAEDRAKRQSSDCVIDDSPQSQKEKMLEDPWKGEGKRTDLLDKLLNETIVLYRNQGFVPFTGKELVIAGSDKKIDLRSKYFSSLTFRLPQNEGTVTLKFKYRWGPGILSVESVDIKRNGERAVTFGPASIAKYGASPQGHTGYFKLYLSSDEKKLIGHFHSTARALFILDIRKPNL